MPDFGGLIGSFLQSAMAPSGNQRMGSALEGLQRGGSQASGAGGGADLLSSLRDAVQGGLGKAAQNPAAAGGMGAILGSLLGGGSDSIKGALGGGALAMLASVAMKSLAANSGGSNGNPAAAFAGQFSTDTGVSPAPQSSQATAELVLRGMINIAKSDGEISREESQRIVGKILETGQLDEDSRQWLAREMQKPLDLQGLAADIPNPQVAAQVYAASLLAVEIDTVAEKQYLEQFARLTGLSPQVVQQIHQAMGLAT
ncbi:MAG: tellurite resistance TerB family protein [Chromatiaceae bacterium]|nr:tellurite resistance TerB family protein [Chromatiaceae bacterium]MCP5441150.1 tellurite resistance TerB family protein [Chromatiaceae bacterium]